MFTINTSQWGRFGALILFLCFASLLGLHFRPPLDIPTIPKLFDPDLIDLQIREAPKDAKIVFLGDSLTERWRFREQLWESSFPGAANLGVGGSRTANMLWLVNSGKLSVFNPEFFVVAIGSNDLRGGPIRFFDRRRPSLAQVEAGERMISDSLKGQFPAAKVIMMPIPGAEDLTGDGVHLTDRGYERWARQLNAELKGSNLAAN